MAYDPLLAEVDDDLRRENLRKFASTFGSYILGISVVILLGTVGIVAWKEHQTSVAQRLTAKLIDAQQLVMADKGAEAQPILKEVADANHATLSPIARLWIGTLNKRNAPEAAKEAVAPMMDAKAADDPYKRYALLLGTDAADLAAMPDDQLNGAFSHTLREAKGIALLQAGKKAEAKAVFHFLAEDSATPPSMRDRAQLLLSTTLAQ